MHFACTDDHFEEKSFFPKKALSFLKFNGNLFGDLMKFSRQCCQNCILRVHRDCSRNFGVSFFLRIMFFITFGHWAYVIRMFGYLLSAGLIKLHSHCAVEGLENFVFFFAEIFFNFSGDPMKMFSLMAQSFQESCWNCIWGQEETFEDKFIFFQVKFFFLPFLATQRKIFGPPANDFGQGCLNCN